MRSSDRERLEGRYSVAPEEIRERTSAASTRTNGRNGRAQETDVKDMTTTDHTAASRLSWSVLFRAVPLIKWLPCHSVFIIIGSSVRQFLGWLPDCLPL